MLTFGAALFLFASLHNTKKDTTRSLRRTSCSGAFVLLDATVNTRMEGAGYSRAGLYVQKGGADTPTVPLLLYRGNADVGKAHSVMPHRRRGNKSPSGAFVSARFPTRRNVYREDCR